METTSGSREPGQESTPAVSQTHATILIRQKVMALARRCIAGVAHPPERLLGPASY
jgi:hypothetical protein